MHCGIHSQKDAVGVVLVFRTSQERRIGKLSLFDAAQLIPIGEFNCRRIAVGCTSAIFDVVVFTFEVPRCDARLDAVLAECLFEAFV